VSGTINSNENREVFAIFGKAPILCILTRTLATGATGKAGLGFKRRSDERSHNIGRERAGWQANRILEEAVMSHPFFGKEFTFRQPDASEVRLRGWGDQQRSRFEFPDGTPSGLDVQSISKAGASMTFTVASASPP